MFGAADIDSATGVLPVSSLLDGIVAMGIVELCCTGVLAGVVPAVVLVSADERGVLDTFDGFDCLIVVSGPGVVVVEMLDCLGLGACSELVAVCPVTLIGVGEAGTGLVVGLLVGEAVDALAETVAFDEVVPLNTGSVSSFAATVDTRADETRAGFDG